MRHNKALKRPCFLLLLALCILASSGCTSNMRSESTSIPQEPTTTSALFPSDDANALPSPETDNIYDLPNQLYVYCPTLNDANAGMSAVNLSHDFKLDQATTYKLAINKDNGKLSFSIKDTNTSEYIIDLNDVPKDNTELSLDLNPGDYRVIIQAKYFQGSYRLERQNTPN